MTQLSTTGNLGAVVRYCERNMWALESLSTAIEHLGPGLFSMLRNTPTAAWISALADRLRQDNPHVKGLVDPTEATLVRWPLVEVPKSWERGLGRLPKRVGSVDVSKGRAVFDAVIVSSAWTLLVVAHPDQEPKMDRVFQAAALARRLETEEKPAFALNITLGARPIVANTKFSDRKLPEWKVTANDSVARYVAARSQTLPGGEVGEGEAESRLLWLSWSVIHRLLVAVGEHETVRIQSGLRGFFDDLCRDLVALGLTTPELNIIDALAGFDLDLTAVPPVPRPPAPPSPAESPDAIPDSVEPDVPAPTSPQVVDQRPGPEVSPTRQPLMGSDSSAETDVTEKAAPSAASAESLSSGHEPDTGVSEATVNESEPSDATPPPRRAASGPTSRATTTEPATAAAPEMAPHPAVGDSESAGKSTETGVGEAKPADLAARAPKPKSPARIRTGRPKSVAVSAAELVDQLSALDLSPDSIPGSVRA